MPCTGPAQTRRPVKVTYGAKVEMNISRMKSNVGRQLRIRPLPHRVTPDGAYLPQTDDLWLLEAVLSSPDRLRLKNIRTDHFVELEPDNLREYRSPDFLVLRCQLIITRTEVRIEPLIPMTTPPGVLPDDWERIEGLMPALLQEMRNDLAAHPSYREVVLLKKSWRYWAKGTELIYYFDDHPDLEAHFQVLENLGLVRNITYNDVTRFHLQEPLVVRLT